MKLLNLEIKNLYGYKKEIIDFNNYSGLILIRGKNDSGKSSLIDIISYILFEQTSRFSKPSDEIIRNGFSHGYGILKFRLQNKVYEIVRGRKNNKPFCDFYCKTDKRKLTERKISGTNKIIQSNLGYNFNIFRNSILFGQGDNSRFVNITDAGRKDIFSNLCSHINLIDNKCKQIKEIINKEQADLMELEIKKSSYADLEGDIKEVKQRIKKLVKKENRLKSKVEVKSKKETMDLDEYKEIKFELKQIEELLNEKKLKFEKKEIAEKCHIDDRNFEIDRHKAKIQYLKKRKRCRHCKQKIPDKIKNEQISDTKLFLEDAIEFKKDIENDLIKIRKEFKSEKIKLKKRMKRLSGKLKLSDEEVIKRKEKDEELRDEYNEIVSDLKYNKKLLNEYDKHYKKDKKIEKKSEKIESKLDDLQILESALGNYGIKQDIIEDLIPILEQKVKFYLDELIDGYFVTFSTTVKSKKGDRDLDKFSILINNGKYTIPYILLGGGIRKRINIAISFALSDFAREQCAADFDFILLDELFGDLDEIGRSRVVELLRKLKSKFDKIFIVSHIPEIQDIADYQIEVVKKNDISKIRKNK